MSHRWVSKQQRKRIRRMVELDGQDDDPGYLAFEERMDDFFLRHPEIDVTGWLIHFMGVGEEATCDDCADHLSGICAGGEEPLKCFAGKRFSSEFVFSDGGR